MRLATIHHPAARCSAAGRPGAAGSGSAAAAATPRSRASSNRRARVLQQVADVQQTLRSLEQAAPLASFEPTERGAAGPAAPLQQQPPNACGHVASGDSSGETDGSIASASAARHARAPSAPRHELQAQASNILAAPRPAAGTCADPAATVTARVCTGKKCSAGGASQAVLARLAATPGVVARPAKCLKQCRRCVAVEMSSGGAPACTLYTGVSAANAADVLALHRQPQLSARP